jgi:hypothetical protein
LECLFCVEPIADLWDGFQLRCEFRRILWWNGDRMECDCSYGESIRFNDDIDHMKLMGFIPLNLCMLSLIWEVYIIYIYLLFGTLRFPPRVHIFL